MGAGSAVAVGKPMAILADLAGPKIRIGASRSPSTWGPQVVVLAPEEIAG
jgi:pyruvate kinase